ncbi:carboxylesterase family domain-containing protein [Ditylenchus destructor]|nr:carboxylesterase family domain-containing protein [Ditylenchus destructor]
MRLLIVRILFAITVLHISYGALPANYTLLPSAAPSINYTTSSESLNYTSEVSEYVSSTQNVRISGGLVRGFESHLGKQPANIFKGVPMAEPPLGKLRFQKLRPRRPWNRIWNATRYSAACLSNTSHTSSPQKYTDEDCIYTNIYADAKCRKSRMRCPVLFYIHGGGFAYDSAIMFNETQIVQKYASDGVVFVVPAYRLGVFGFLDLRNDNIVPRNLGFHDIIFALEWTKQEIKSFGGDPDKISIMGNSAGAAAVEYLLASPIVPQKLFKQAIVISGIPSLTNDTNRPQSLALLSHFKCLFNETTNRTYSDIEKVKCLRNVSAQDLINAQKDNEDKFNLVFHGPETDTEVLPGQNYAELMSYYKARPLLITTTTKEMTFKLDPLDQECRTAEIAFGYATRAVHQACLSRYNSTYNSSDPRITAESYRSVSFLISLINARKGAPTYRGFFTLANHTGHADDLLFFFGLHWRPIGNTLAEKMMDRYYPTMIKNFLKIGAPERDWKRVDQSGNNYYVLDFQTQNDTLVVKPHPERGLEDPEALKFWLRDASFLERTARKMSQKRKNKQSNRHSSHRKSKNHSQFWLPVFRNMVLPVLPPENYTLETSDDMLQKIGLSELVGNSTVNHTGIDDQNSPLYETDEGLITTGNLVGSGLINGQPAIIVHDAGMPVREVWSAFWLSLTVVVLLSIVIVMMLGSRMLYRYKNARGYSYNSPDGYFTETTRIISKNERPQRYS